MTIQYQKEVTTFLKDFTAGGIAAGISETVVAPLERIKILLQVQHVSRTVAPERHYRGVIDALIRIPKEQGVLSLWRGNLTHVIRCWPSYALNFAFKESYKKVLVQEAHKTSDFKLYFFGNLLAGGLAGVTTLCFVYPLDFVETRLAADTGHSHVHREFTGILNCMNKIVKTDGMGGLYRGFVASAQGVFLYRASYFGLFDIAKSFYPNPDKIPLFMSWLTAQIVTTVSSFTSYPFDTVRRRMMMQSGLSASAHMYRSTAHCWKLTYQREGLMGFYKGAMTNMVRSLGGALVLVIYDRIKPMLFRTER